MRIFARLLLVLTLMLVGGFFVFNASLKTEQQFDLETAQSKIDDIEPSKIGIVVLTGGGGDRIEKAFDVLAEAEADRILISGTHPDVRKADLAQRFDAHVLDCCVDLGTEALTTVGNAREALDWAEERDYAALYIVTHDYHLPRAMLEFKSHSSDLSFVSVPVAHRTDEPAWELLIKEYGKFLLAVIRTVI